MFSFFYHSSFPVKDSTRKQQWIKNISREDVNGKPWQPSSYDRVCSAHFTPADYKVGTLLKCLKDDAVPTVFPNYPRHKQLTPSRKRPPPKQRLFPSPSTPHVSSPPLSKYSCMCHTYSYRSVEEHLRITKQKLVETEHKLVTEREKTRILGQKVHRQNCKISGILKELKEQNVMSKEGVDVITDNFGENALSLIQNELKAATTTPQGMRYSDSVKSFATTLHFYSPKAYKFFRSIFTLPDESTIRKWSASLDCRPGFIKDMLNCLKEKVEADPSMKDITLMFDAMAIRSE